jgi:uncharacterized integral membrane protein
MSGGRWAALVAIAVLSGLFAYLNAGQRVTLHLGFITVYRLSISHVVLGAFLLGMVSMFLVGLRNDLRLRRTQQVPEREPVYPLAAERSSSEVDRYA